MTPYQENRLIVYRGKIENIKKQAAYLKTKVYLYAAVGIVLSFITPFYGDGGESIMDRLGGSYQKAFMFSVAVVFSFILIGGIVFHFQDKLRIKKLQKKIAIIEAEIVQAVPVEGC